MPRRRKTTTDPAARHLDGLTSVAAAVAHSADLETLLEAALDATLACLELSVGGIYLFDAEGRELRSTRHHRGVSFEYMDSVARFEIGEALEGQRLETPRVVPDLSAAPEARAATREQGLRSFVLVPLTARDRTVGVMPVGGREQRVFTAQELTLLEAVGGLLGGALSHRRLLESARRHLDQVQALWEIDKAISEDRDLREVLDTIAREAAALGDADSAIALLDPAGELKPAGSCGRLGLALLEHPEREGASELPQRLLAAEPGHLRLPGSGTEPGRLVLTIPLRAGARPLGGLLIVKPADAAREDDLTLLSTFGHQAAIALAKARAREAEDRRAQQLALVSQAAEIAASTLELDTLLGALARYIHRSLGYYSVALFLVESQVGEARLVGAAGAATSLPRGQRVRLGSGIVGAVAASGEYVLANDVSREPRYVRAGMELAQSELAVPVRLSGEVVAVIDVEAERVDAFDEGDLVTLDAIAGQVAGALANARLFEEKLRALRSLEILQEITNVLNSDLELDGLLERIARRSVEAVRPAQMGAVLLYDGDALGVRSSCGYPAPEALGRARLAFHEGLPGAVFVSGHGRHTGADVDLGAAAEAFVEAAGGARPRSALCVPIALPEEKLGVLLLQNCSSPQAFDEDALRFASTLAHQAAIAIGNALRVRRILELNEHRKSYLANVSHELRSPLTVVQGYLESLVEGSAGDQAGAFLRVAHEQTQRLGRMIDEVLEVARLEDGVARQPVKWRPVRLGDVLRRVVQGLRQELCLKRLKLSERLAPSLPELAGDERLLHLLVQNLVENAVKFTPDGGRIEIEALVSDDVLRLVVSDDGPGIAAEHHERIFEKFFTVDAGLQRTHGGAGIGLYLAREVVAIHSGSLRVSSSLGAGSRFEVRLPLASRVAASHLDGTPAVAL